MVLIRTIFLFGWIDFDSLVPFIVLDEAVEIHFTGKLCPCNS